MSKQLIETVPYENGKIEIYKNLDGSFESKCWNPQGEDITHLKGYDLIYSKGQRESAISDAKKTIDRLIKEQNF